MRVWQDCGGVLAGMVEDIGQFLDSLDLGITYLGEGGWPGVGECVGESASGADGGVSRGAFRYRTIMGKNSTVLTMRSARVFGMYTR